jgi:catechol 2,3-dioxygenase-like lactoylglutathione lyase family enzyme
LTGIDPPAVSGVLETCLYVADVARSRAFYERVFGFTAMIADDRICAFDVAPGSVLILFRKGATLRPVPVGGGHIPPHDGGGPQHFAFAVQAEDWQNWKHHLAENRVAVESEVSWPQGGRSLYFHDPDGLVVELATPGLWRNY